MKMVLVAYSEGLESEVMDAVTAQGLRNYTKLTGVLGKGDSSGPHMGTHVWPRQNHLLLAAVEDQVAAGVLEAVRRLRETFGREGVKAFVLPLEDL